MSTCRYISQQLKTTNRMEIGENVQKIRQNWKKKNEKMEGLESADVYLQVATPLGVAIMKKVLEKNGKTYFSPLLHLLSTPNRLHPCLHQPRLQRS